MAAGSDIWRKPAPEPEPGELPRVFNNIGLIIQKRYPGCGHVEIWQGGSLPEELVSLTIAGLSDAELKALLPRPWYLAGFSPEKVVLESVGSVCPLCSEEGYLGIWNNNIAIFRGQPPRGRLERVTEFEVKEDVRDQLEKGIPFGNLEELMQLLESYTS